jgi:hypothetical protein
MPNTCSSSEKVQTQLPYGHWQTCEIAFSYVISSPEITPPQQCVTTTARQGGHEAVLDIKHLIPITAKPQILVKYSKRAYSRRNMNN